VIEKTITIFRNKKPKNLKFGLLGFFRFFKKNLKNLGFLKATSTALFNCLITWYMSLIFQQLAETIDF